MNYILLSLLSLFLVSCTQSDSSSQRLPLFNGYSFSLLKAEVPAKKNFASNETYVKYFNNDSLVQLPLFHYIKTNEYEVFVGVPVNSGYAALEKVFSDDSASVQETNSGFIFVKTIQEKSYLTKYVYKMDSVSVIGIFVKTGNQKLSDSLFTRDLLTARIVKE